MHWMLRIKRFSKIMPGFSWATSFTGVIVSSAPCE
jgi:hypothetical protein